MRKKREYQSSELVQKLAKIYGFGDILVSFKIRDFLQDFLGESLFSEVKEVRIKDDVLTIKINSPLLKNDFLMRKSFYIQKIHSDLDIKIREIIVL